MRVAFNALAATRGGAVTHLNGFLAALRAVRPEWEMLVLTTQADVSASVETLPGVEVERIHCPGQLTRVSEELYRLDDRAHRWGAAAVANLLNSGALRPRSPTVTWQRNALYFDRTWLQGRPLRERGEAAFRRSIALACSRASDGVIVPSRAMGQYLTSWRLGRSLKFHVVPHGVDTSRFAFRPRDLPGRGATVIGVMGHPAAHRGLDLATQALYALRRDGHDVRLRLTVSPIGNPAFQESVDRLVASVEQLGLRDFVVFEGPIEEPERWYDTLNLLLVPSRCESFCLPLVEAMAAGVPVVSSDLPAMRELGGDAIWYARPNDAGAIASAVESILIADDAVIRQKVERGRETADQFGWKDSAEGAARVIESAVRTSTRRAP
jgi:glycosyltransferase involved in cell wall biosynthesis